MQLKKILIILSRVPYPLEKGDKLRAFHQIKVLSKKFDITLFAINDPATPSNSKAIEVLGKFCSRVEFVDLSWPGIWFNIIKSFFSAKPLQSGYFFSSKAKKQLDSLIQAIQPDHIYCQLVRTAEYIKDVKYAKTIDYMDALSKGIERRIPNASFFMKLILKIELNRLRKYESHIFDWFDDHTIISEQDRGHIDHPKSLAIHVVPNGVDTDYFHPSNHKKVFDIIFSGNMAYPPNIETARYITKEVLPIVKKELPEVKLVIAGAKPPVSVLSLSSKNVIVTGWIEDMREYYKSARVFIAPMHTSIGMQNKILEAMAMAIPCITSPMANNAIKAVDGESILIGETPKEYAKHLINVLKDDQLSRKLSVKGCEFVTTRYSWEGSTSKLIDIFT